MPPSQSREATMERSRGRSLNCLISRVDKMSDKGGSIVRYEGPHHFLHPYSSISHYASITASNVVIETNKSKTARCKVSQQHLKLTLISSYHLHTKYKSKEVIVHNEMLTNMINKIPKSSPVIVRADINESLGMRKKREETDTTKETNMLGPHGNNKKNDMDKMILNML